jgi:hypothetical protein
MEGEFEGWVEEVDSSIELRFRSTGELLQFFGKRFNLAMAPTGQERVSEDEKVRRKKRTTRKDGK